MTTITEKVKQACLSSDPSGRAVRMALMELFKKLETTIIVWIKSGDIRLTTVDALAIIEQETGIPKDQITCPRTTPVLSNEE